MFDWKTTTQGHSAVHSCEYDISDWKEFRSLAVEFWNKLLTEINTACSSGHFDRIYIEFWSDSGRIIGFPGLKGTLRSDWPLAVQVQIPFVYKVMDRLPTPDLDAGGFERGSRMIEAKIWSGLTGASNDRRLEKLFKEIRSGHDFTIWRQSAGNFETLCQMFLVV